MIAMAMMKTTRVRVIGLSSMARLWLRWNSWLRLRFRLIMKMRWEKMLILTFRMSLWLTLEL